MEVIILVFVYYFFFSKRSIGDDFIKASKYVLQSIGNICFSLFRFGVNPVKPRFGERKRVVSSNQKTESANSGKHKEVDSQSKQKSESVNQRSNISVTLSRANYCPVNEFYLLLDNKLQRAIWRYYVDNNITKDIQNHVVIFLDRTATKPKKWDITEDCLAMNLPLVWKIISLEYKKISSKGMIPVVLALYNEQTKRLAS